MKTSVSKRVVGAIVVLAASWVTSVVSVAQAPKPVATNAPAPPPKVRISIDPQMLFTSPTPGQILVFGDVTSLVKDQTITYWPKISLEALHTAKKSVLTSTWTWHGQTDKDVFTVKPGETNRLFCMAGGKGADNQTGFVEYSGKGTIRVYVTAKPGDPVEARISNLLRVSVDLDKKTASIIDDGLQPAAKRAK